MATLRWLKPILIENHYFRRSASCALPGFFFSVFFATTKPRSNGKKSDNVTSNLVDKLHRDRERKIHRIATTLLAFSTCHFLLLLSFMKRGVPILYWTSGSMQGEAKWIKYHAPLPLLGKNRTKLFVTLAFATNEFEEHFLLGVAIFHF